MSSPDSLTSIGTLAAGGQPVVPSLPIENLIEQLSSHASEVLAAQDRLRLFHRAYGQIVGELSLEVLLQRITHVSREVVGARYAALGLVGLDGRFHRFLHSGLDPATTAAAEQPAAEPDPDAAVEDPRMLDLRRALEQPRTEGPANEVPVEGFLGVPIRCRDEVYAVLYLADQVSGRPFSSADEELAEALVATAGIAIENALLYEESRRRQDWLRAAADLSQYLLGCQDDASAVLQRIVSVVRTLLDGDTAALVVPQEGGTTLAIVAAEGAGAAALHGLVLPSEGSMTQQAMDLGRGLHADLQRTGTGPEADLATLAPLGPLLALPLGGGTRSQGAILTARRPGALPFTQAELRMAETFAGQAAVAVQLVEARTDRQRLSGMEQRDQIAQALHGDVVQRLVGIGTGVQALAQEVREPAIRQRLERGVQEVDETIRQIRSSIFTLLAAPPTARSLATVVEDLVEELRLALDLPVDLRLDGPLDWPAEAGLVRDVEAVLREALTNVSKYARASRVEVGVRTDGTTLALAVADDGVGLGASTRRSGLDNLGRRAERYGGRLSIDEMTEGGLSLTWAIPL